MSDGVDYIVNNDVLVECAVTYRKNSGKTISEIAKALNTSQPQISRLESGKHSPRLQTFEVYLQSFGYELLIAPKDSSDILTVYVNVLSNIVEALEDKDNPESEQRLLSATQKARLLLYFETMRNIDKQ